MGSSKAAEKELVELFEKVQKAADKAITDEAEEQRCLDALKALRAVPVTMSVLVSSQVGKRLRHLTKHPQESICVLATGVLDSWKKVVTTETLANNGNKATKSEDKQSKTIKVEVNAVKQGSVKVEKKPKEEEASISNKKVSSSSDGPPKLTSMIKCNNTVRDRIRELLHEAFSKVGNEAEGDNLVRVNASDPVRVAVSVETLMFEKLGLSTGAQKLKYRSIMFNLKDANNPDLRRRVLLGEIKPEKLIVMTAEEMASDQRKLENKQIKDKALFECERGIKPKATTDQFKCGKCGQRKCTYYQLQTRSADEPMTTFVTCVNCNNHWKFC